MQSTFRRHAFVLTLLLTLVHARRSHAADGAIVDDWKVPQHQHLLVARLYRRLNNVRFEVPRAFLALVVDGDRVHWLPLRADDQFMWDQLSMAADATARGRDEPGNGGVFSDRADVERRGRAVKLRIVDRAHARAEAQSAEDRDAAGVHLALRQSDGLLEADLTGFGPEPLHASFPLGEAWTADIVELRDCLAAGSTYSFCELVRKYDYRTVAANVPTATPQLIVRLHARQEALDAYLVMLFSTRADPLEKNARFVQWFITQPRDTSERTQLDAWAAAGATGPILSPRLTAEIARQRTSAYASRLSTSGQSFVPGFYFDRPDGTSLVARTDGDHLYFLAGRGNSLAQFIAHATDVDYIGTLPVTPAPNPR